jgi:uncharacterized lipoprotein NlpE involved in copper resistance
METIQGNSPQLSYAINELALETSQQQAIKNELDSYVTYLCGQMNLDAAKIEPRTHDLLAAFKSEGRTGVNKLLLSNDEFKKQATTYTLSENDKNLLKEFSEKFNASEITKRVLENERILKDLDARITSRLNDAYYYLKQRAETRAHLLQLLGTKEDENLILSAVERLIARGILFHATTAEGCILFETPQITLSYFNKEAGVAQSVPMGSFVISVRITDFKVLVVKGTNNVLVEEYFHPHVGSSGSLCFGNAANAYKDSVANKDLEKCVLTVLAVLSEYNDESPYCSLHEFYLTKYPEKFANLGTIWQKETSQVQVEYDSLDTIPAQSDIVETFTDEEGIEQIVFHPWIKVFVGTQVKVKNASGDYTYAIRARNGQKVEADTSNWEWL